MGQYGLYSKLRVHKFYNAYSFHADLKCRVHRSTENFTVHHIIALQSRIFLYNDVKYIFAYSQFLRYIIFKYAKHEDITQCVGTLNSFL